MQTVIGTNQRTAKGPPMTQPEDDAARLARECAEAIDTRPKPNIPGAADYVNEYLVRKWNEDISPIAEKIAPIIRARLAERDARERMVREENVKLRALAEKILEYEESYVVADDDTRGFAEVVLEVVTPRLRAAISAKSDEQTPTTTGVTNGK
jgi:hypothetical protein